MVTESVLLAADVATTPRWLQLQREGSLVLKAGPAQDILAVLPRAAVHQPALDGVMVMPQEAQEWRFVHNSAL